MKYYLANIGRLRTKIATTECCFESVVSMPQGSASISDAAVTCNAARHERFCLHKMFTTMDEGCGREAKWNHTWLTMTELLTIRGP